MADKNEKDYNDFSNVEIGANYVIPEDTPEGPYGSPVHKKLGKTSPWHEAQRSYSAFNYEFKSLHQDLPRQDPGAHPPHDDKTKKEDSYTSK